MYCTVSFVKVLLIFAIMISRSNGFGRWGNSVLARTSRAHRSPLMAAGVGFSTKDIKTKKTDNPVPITVLSGFLGAGKTSFLSNTLAKRDGKKFGLVVNDMATVNVDAKQIRQQTFDPFGGIDTMELQDGCVCCTLAEDMIASVSKLISMSELKNEAYDHIVVECSGIAEPRKIRDLFQQAADYKLELLKKVRLDTLITLVDATVFLNLFGSDEAIANNRKLAYKDQEMPKDPNDQNTYTYLDGSESRKVTDLLLEQVECADIVMINKCDLLSNPADIVLVQKVISSINPLAKMYTCVNGVVTEPLTLLGSARGTGAADWGVLDEHRKLIDAVEKAAQLRAQQEQQSAVQAATQACVDATCTDPTHKHEHHDHGHQHGGHGQAQASSHAVDCHDAACTDPSHDHTHSGDSHGHNHAHSAAHKEDCHSAICTDPTHDHSHGNHAHTHRDECHTTTCTDPTHNHSHGGHGHAHDHKHSDECHATACTDPAHDHSHGDHDHAHSHTHRNADMTTAEDRFGITSFVYRRRRPFHPVRFSMFLQSLGNLSVKGVAEMGMPAVTNKAPGAAAADVATGEGAKEAAVLTRAKRALLRSKGFVWMATSAQAAYFMSHAGQYLELLVLGRWWAAIDQAEWPKEVLSEVTVDFDGANGDRRQELVFIGQFAKDGGTSQRALEGVLDECLLTPEEMAEYEKVANKGDDALRSHFAPGY